MTTTPTRIEADLYDSAKKVGNIMSRSTTQQINHWARIGREIEMATTAGHRDIARVLAGRASYDDLEERAQAIVRVEWDERAADRVAALNFAEEFAAEDTTGWVTAGPDGKAVVHGSAESARTSSR